ncbi:MAG: hypothetical protein JXR76_30810 [Deltaproteobacteria bacterium]|nr:hypothetical protein [Deltaproteobacteria bacterium]
MKVTDRIAIVSLIIFFMAGYGSSAVADESMGSADAGDALQAPSSDDVVPPADEPPSDIPTEQEPPADTPPPADNASPPSLSEPISGEGAPQPSAGAATGAPSNLTGITTVPAKPLEEPLPEEATDAAAPSEATSRTDDSLMTEPPSGVAAGASAQTDTGASPPPAYPPAPMDDDEQKFAAFSFSPQIGYAYFPKSDFEYNGLKFHVDKRNAFVLKLHLDLGGDGLAFELVPSLAYQKIGGDITSFGADLSDGVAGSLLAVGGQMNLMFRGSWGSFFPHLGIGFHGSYLYGDEIEYGADIYGRIPAGFTWYFAKHLGLVVEFAFMIGATGIRRKVPDTKELYADLESEYGVDQQQVEDYPWESVNMENPADRQKVASDLGITSPTMTSAEAEAIVSKMVEDQMSKVIQFGRGIGLEFMVGIRFP